MLNPLPKWIVFDAADTLIRPEPSVATVYQNVAQQFGVTISCESIKQRFQPAIQKHFDEAESSEQLDHQRWRNLVFDVIGSKNEQLFAKLWEHFADVANWRLYDDVSRVWQQIQQRGIGLAIASNFDARLLKIVDGLSPLNQSQHIFISSQIGYRKPSVHFFREIASRLNVDADELLMIGDSRHADFQGARDAGWQALHLDRNRPSHAETDDEFVIASLDQLLGLLP